MKCRVIKDLHYHITSQYGQRSSGFHSGVDMVGRETENGTNILGYITAHSDGVVEIAIDGKENQKGSTGTDSYGNYVMINHNNGYKTLYAHMQKGIRVRKGDIVSEGQVIGYMGNTGNSYGGHLHFEVREDGERVDPTPFISNPLEVSDEVLYQVKKGDTLTKIAEEHNCSVKDIAQINGIANPNLIVIGQLLHIPIATNKATVETVVEKVTSYKNEWLRGCQTGIFNGTDNPNDYITKDEFCVILSRLGII